MVHFICLCTLSLPWWSFHCNLVGWWISPDIRAGVGRHLKATGRRDASGFELLASKGRLPISPLCWTLVSWFGVNTCKSANPCIIIIKLILHQDPGKKKHTKNRAADESIFLEWNRGMILFLFVLFVWYPTSLRSLEIRPSQPTGASNLHPICINCLLPEWAGHGRQRQDTPRSYVGRHLPVPGKNRLGGLDWQSQGFVAVTRPLSMAQSGSSQRSPCYAPIAVPVPGDTQKLDAGVLAWGNAVCRHWLL